MYDEIINKIKKEFEYNELLNFKFNSDSKNKSKTIDFEKIKNIINYFKTVNIDSDIDFNDNIVIYNGNIYLTFYLCMQALLKNKRLKLYTENYMVKTNKAIIDMFNKVCKDNNLNQIEFDLCHLYKDILKIVKDTDNVFIIGNTFAYHELYSLNKIKYYPFYNLMIYIENDEKNDYKKLFEMVLYYLDSNMFEYEIINEQYEDIINYIDEDFYSNTFLAITDNEDVKKLFKNNIKHKKVFINSNPFKEYENNILDYLKPISF